MTKQSNSIRSKEGIDAQRGAAHCIVSCLLRLLEEPAAWEEFRSSPSPRYQCSTLQMQSPLVNNSKGTVSTGLLFDFSSGISSFSPGLEKIRFPGGEESAESCHVSGCHGFCGPESSMPRSQSTKSWRHWQEPWQLCYEGAPAVQRGSLQGRQLRLDA